MTKSTIRRVKKQPILGAGWDAGFMLDSEPVVKLEFFNTYAKRMEQECKWLDQKQVRQVGFRMVSWLL